jgi:hypothetical protein
MDGNYDIIATQPYPYFFPSVVFGLLQRLLFGKQWGNKNIILFLRSSSTENMLFKQ